MKPRSFVISGIYGTVVIFGIRLILVARHVLETAQLQSGRRAVHKLQFTECGSLAIMKFV